MDFQQITEIIKIFDKSSLTELRISLSGASVELSKGGRGLAETAAPQPAKMSVAGEKPVPELDEPVVIIPDAKMEVKEGTVVVSPIVGTFYDAPSPDKPPYVRQGGRVKAGDVLCIVEAMKVMNEITAKQDGVIAEIMVSSEDMVEYNQPLFRII